MVDKTKIMQCHLLTEVVVEFEDELGNLWIEVLMEFSTMMPNLVLLVASVTVG